MCAKLPLQECFNNKITGLERKNSRQARELKKGKGESKSFMWKAFSFSEVIYMLSLCIHISFILLYEDRGFSKVGQFQLYSQTLKGE